MSKPMALRYGNGTGQKVLAKHLYNRTEPISLPYTVRKRWFFFVFISIRYLDVAH